MAAFVIADVEVIDSVAYEEYRQKAPATVAAYGGRYIARGGAIEVLEGAWSPKRCVLLEFASMAELRAWWNSPEYRPLRAMRQRVTKSRLVAVEGL
jgi:uncharacterized protein (DUF1330 family)